MQTDDERQQALQVAFSSASSGGPSLPSPLPGAPEVRPKAKKNPRKNQIEKYRLKYLRLRKAARTMIFVSSGPQALM